MKDINEIKKIIKQHLNIIADKYGVAVVGIFGSYARGEQEQRSDIDLLAEILRPISLLEIEVGDLNLSSLDDGDFVLF